MNSMNGMTDLPDIGTISSEAFLKLIFPHLGAPRSKVIVSEYGFERATGKSFLARFPRGFAELRQAGE